MSSIFQRRSVRSFLPKPVEDDKIERILRAGMEAPSAHNRRPWEFIVITGEADRQAIAGMSPYAKMAASAAAIIGVCVNLDLGGVENPEDTWWVQDLSAVTENILLQIVEEGLGGVWLGWYPDKDRVRAFADRFKFPPTVLPFSVIPLGYPAKKADGADRFDPRRVHYGVYGTQK
ncbi:NADPH-flavin oxidoreductase [Treponema primitia ZAS-2]|uniref:NADPH-flavin oxidoreductase n=1 Tax=Treponema primitia (strain ATCC BAA-887 / DSM 12427 / ZAS-2) TaxID=545694 RepID=F5YL01_TREPZ|nr:nitroreductase family protein [Treponema primitia]AEF86877.1 NADPH-flavin oxidoreductase [Treponema primitia ZAS-2]